MFSKIEKLKQFLTSNLLEMKKEIKMVQMAMPEKGRSDRLITRKLRSLICYQAGGDESGIVTSSHSRQKGESSESDCAAYTV